MKLRIIATVGALVALVVLIAMLIPQLAANVTRAPEPEVTVPVTVPDDDIDDAELRAGHAVGGDFEPLAVPDRYPVGAGARIDDAELTLDAEDAFLGVREDPNWWYHQYEPVFYRVPGTQTVIEVAVDEVSAPLEGDAAESARATFGTARSAIVQQVSLRARVVAGTDGDAWDAARHVVPRGGRISPTMLLGAGEGCTQSTKPLAGVEPGGTVRVCLLVLASWEAPEVELLALELETAGANLMLTTSYRPHDEHVD